MVRKVLKFTGLFLLVLALLCVAFFVAVRYPAFQTYLAQRATAILSSTLNTKVSIERVEISFYDRAHLVNFYMEDRQHDTLIYAKDLEVRLKLFELFGKKLKVKSINLQNGMLHLHRDSTGQVLNIAQVFESFKQNKNKPVPGQGGTKWDIGLEELALHNTDFRYWDEKSKSDIKVGVGLLKVQVKNIDLQKKLVYLNSIEIDGADVLVDLMKRQKAPEDTSGPFHLFTDGTKLTFDDFALKNSRFRLNDHNNDTINPTGVDFKHLDVTPINLLAQRGAIIGDTVTMLVKSLSAKERSGFELRRLSAELRVSVNEVVLDKLNLVTPNSEITDYLSLHYNSFGDFKDFLNAVRIKARLDNTKFSIKDLAYFVKHLEKAEHNVFYVNGEIDGRINKLKGRGIEIRTGQNTIFKGDFYMYGLPDIYQTSLNIRVTRLATTPDDIRRIFPSAVIPPNLNTLGLIYFTGSLDGFATDFVSKGKFVTSIGSATTDVNFKYNKDKNKAFYSGALALNEFDLGKYLNASELIGAISLEAKIKGGGITLESLDAQLDGNISSMVFRGYDYKDIKVNGSVLKKSFSGILSVHDKYLDMDFNGTADLTHQLPSFNFSANIRNANLKNLHLLKDSICLAGKMSSNFTGSKADDLVGKVEINNLLLTRDSVKAEMKRFVLDAKLLSNEKKSITLVSDYAEGEMTGDFTLKDLPKSLLNFVKYAFTRQELDTLVEKVHQDFSLDLRIYEPGNLPRIFIPKLYNVSSSRITCDFNSDNHDLKITANIPQVQYDNFTIKGTQVEGGSVKRLLDFNCMVDRVYNGDSLMLDSIRANAKSVDDNFKFDLSASDAHKASYANIAANLTPLKDRALIQLQPSDIKLGGNNWHFDPGNFIFVQGNRITTQNLVFRTADQTIYANFYLKDDTSTSFKLTLDNANLADFTRIFAAKSKDLGGIASGKLVVEDVFTRPQVYADFVVSDFMLGTEIIGDVNLETRLDSLAKNIIVFASVKGLNNDIEATGKISIDPAMPGIDIDVDAKYLGLNFLNYKFFDRYVKDCRGYAVAKIKVYNTLKKPLLKGDVTLVDDTVTVSFLNTRYKLHNQKAKLDEHGFNLNGITISDVKGGEAYATGRINHESFRDFELDLQVTTGQNVFQFLNTTAKLSPNFYGVAYGKGGVKFFGPINSPVIKAYATTMPGTYCKLPINSSYEVNRYSFYKFVTHGKDSVANSGAPKLKLNGVTFNLDLTVTPDARMDIILDPIAGDVLSGYGEGTLNIEIPRNGNTTMRGQYTLERGSYLFTLQNIINKRFDLIKGGTVDFDGEIYKARLNLDAVYQVRTSVSDLIDDLINNGNTTTTSQTSTTGSTSGGLAAAAQSRIPIDLLLKLTGVLERPNIAFDIRAIDPDPTIKSYVEQKLTLLKSNESELNKQVFGLLVMNRFIPQTSSASNAIGNGNYIGGTAANTVSEFLSSQFSNYLSNLLEFANIRNLDVNIGYRQYDQSTITTGSTPQTTLDTRRELQLALSQRLLNNRLSINAGGNLDFGSGSGSSTDPAAGVTPAKAVIPTGDFQIEYSLTADGVWRAKAFNRTNYDYFNARSMNRTGLGISYRQEFDKPSDLFHKKTKPAKKDKKTDENKSAIPPANNK